MIPTDPAIEPRGNETVAPVNGTSSHEARGAAGSLTTVERGRSPGKTVSEGRLAFIDGLRGLAMLMVLGYHCWVHTIRMPIDVPVGRWRLDVTSPLHLGYLGVHLFLVLSGFCLTYPLVRGGAETAKLDMGRFFRRRAWRILPPYYAALALFALLPLLDRSATRGQLAEVLAPATLGQILSHVFMVHNFSLAWMGSINASFWSLALEWQLYMLFPFLVWGFRRWGPARTTVAVLALTLAYRTWVYHTQDVARIEVGYIYGYALPGRLFEFVLGMAAALVYARTSGSPEPRRARRYLAGVVSFGLLGVVVSHRWTPFSPVTDVIWGLAFACLVMYGGSRSVSGGCWLDARPLVALGLISYSVYLVHEPLIRMAYAALLPLHLAPSTTLLLFEGVAAPLLIGLGWLFFSAIEVRFVHRRPRG